jgi:hypothetical protein
MFNDYLILIILGVHVATAGLYLFLIYSFIKLITVKNIIIANIPVLNLFSLVFGLFFLLINWYNANKDKVIFERTVKKKKVKPKEVKQEVKKEIPKPVKKPKKEKVYTEEPL